MEFYEKKIQITNFLQESAKTSDLYVAFSGGADSSLLLALAVRAGKEAGRKVCALTADTVLHPKGDLQTARQVAEALGAKHRIVFIDELEEEAIRQNPVNRCYLCKKKIFTEFLRLAGEGENAVLLEGSNGDDLQVYRPGIRAVRELGVQSPLAACGLTKAEVRSWAAELGISTASRPSTPCMATRLPYGALLDAGVLERIERGEELLREAGFADIRLRLHGEILRIEVAADAFPKVLKQREMLIRELKRLGFRYLTLDLEGFRSGSMDEYITY